MTSIKERIEEAPDDVIAGAVRNLRLELEGRSGPMDDDQTRAVVQAADLSGDAAELRDAVVTDQGSLSELARLGRGLLTMLADDPDAQPAVVAAFDDAEEASTMDFGITALIVLGAVTVLWRFRPKSVEKTETGFKVTWPKDDGSDAAGLAKVFEAWAKILAPTG
jgi:hypothetical protein